MDSPNSVSSNATENINGKDSRNGWREYQVSRKKRKNKSCPKQTGEVEKVQSLPQNSNNNNISEVKAIANTSKTTLKKSLPINNKPINLVMLQPVCPVQQTVVFTANKNCINYINTEPSKPFTAATTGDLINLSGNENILTEFVKKTVNQVREYESDFPSLGESAKLSGKDIKQLSTVCLNEDSPLKILEDISNQPGVINPSRVCSTDVSSIRSTLQSDIKFSSNNKINCYRNDASDEFKIVEKENMDLSFLKFYDTESQVYHCTSVITDGLFDSIYHDLEEEFLNQRSLHAKSVPLPSPCDYEPYLQLIRNMFDVYRIANDVNDFSVFARHNFAFPEHYVIQLLQIPAHLLSDIVFFSHDEFRFVPADKSTSASSKPSLDSVLMRSKPLTLEERILLHYNKMAVEYPLMQEDRKHVIRELLEFYFSDVGLPYSDYIGRAIVDSQLSGQGQRIMISQVPWQKKLMRLRVTPHEVYKALLGSSRVRIIDATYVELVEPLKEDVINLIIRLSNQSLVPSVDCASQDSCLSNLKYSDPYYNSSVWRPPSQMRSEASSVSPQHESSNGAHMASIHNSIETAVSFAESLPTTNIMPPVSNYLAPGNLSGSRTRNPSTVSVLADENVRPDDIFICLEESMFPGGSGSGGAGAGSQGGSAGAALGTRRRHISERVLARHPGGDRHSGLISKSRARNTKRGTKRETKEAVTAALHLDWSLLCQNDDDDDADLDEAIHNAQVRQLAAVGVVGSASDEEDEDDEEEDGEDSEFDSQPAVNLGASLSSLLARRRHRRLDPGGFSSSHTSGSTSSLIHGGLMKAAVRLRSQQQHQQLRSVSADRSTNAAVPASSTTTNNAKSSLHTAVVTCRCEERFGWTGQQRRRLLASSTNQNAAAAAPSSQAPPPPPPPVLPPVVLNDVSAAASALMVDPLSHLGYQQRVNPLIPYFDSFEFANFILGLNQYVTASHNLGRPDLLPPTCGPLYYPAVTSGTTANTSTPSVGLENGRSAAPLTAYGIISSLLQQQQQQQQHQQESIEDPADQSQLVVSNSPQQPTTSTSTTTARFTSVLRQFKSSICEEDPAIVSSSSTQARGAANTERKSVARLQTAGKSPSSVHPLRIDSDGGKVKVTDNPSGVFSYQPRVRTKSGSIVEPLAGSSTTSMAALYQYTSRGRRLYYDELLQKALKDRSEKPVGQSQWMNLYFNVARGILIHRFNREIYDTFKTYAIEDDQKGARYGIQCLFYFFSYSLELKFRPDLFMDFEHLVSEDLHNGKWYGYEKLWAFFYFSAKQPHGIVKDAVIINYLRNYNTKEKIRAMMEIPHTFKVVAATTTTTKTTTDATTASVNPV